MATCVLPSPAMFDFEWHGDRHSDDARDDASRLGSITLHPTCPPSLIVTTDKESVLFEDMPRRAPHMHLGELARPFTPVSPSNLDPITSRFQQVSLADYVHPLSGKNTPHASTPDQQSFFDEDDDIRRETRADADRAFPVDRVVLKDIISKKMDSEVAYLQFLSSGTFHKAFLAHLSDGREVVARVARRFMPSLKVESEVATINYLRTYTDIPVPTIYHYDANPYNKLGNEYILMSKAPGVPLSFVYSRLTEPELRMFFRNLAGLIVPLLAHRFPQSGSLYQSSVPIDKPASLSGSGIASTRSSPSGSPVPLPPHDLSSKPGFIVGPIVSWPFFGDGRGELDATEIDRGPWTSEREYIQACARREIETVHREAEGTEKGHRPHLPPKSRRTRGAGSRSHSRSTTAVSTLRGAGQFPPPSLSTGRGGGRVGVGGRGVGGRGFGATRIGIGHPDDSSDESGSLSESSDSTSDSSEDENFYRDYRINLRSSLLVAQHAARLESVTNDMDRFMRYMTEELGIDENDPDFAPFSFHAHDLSLANIFVDPEDHTKITCIIDWESTTIRPLWHCAHLPAFLLPHPHAHTPMPSPTLEHEQAMFRSEVAKLGPLGELWLRAESERVRWREAHRFLEWDGWEEGLLDSVIGPETYRSNHHSLSHSPMPSPMLDGFAGSFTPLTAAGGGVPRAGGGRGGVGQPAPFRGVGAPNGGFRGVGVGNGGFLGFTSLT